MTARLISALSVTIFATEVAAQSAVDVVRPEDQQRARRAVVKEQEKRAKRTSIIEFRGEQAFKDKDLRVALKEEITTIEDFGLSPARADDLAFYLEVFYRKHGYAKVNVQYVIESGDRLRLDINEGPRFMLSQVIFDGNAHEPADKLFEYMVGPTRERYSRLEKRLPFVPADLEEGTHLVQRFYVAEGFLNAVVDPPRDKFQAGSSEVAVTVPIHEGRQYFFGNITFSGNTVYGSEALRGQISDLLQRPYTDLRVEDIPRRLEAYFKARGYYDVKVVANGTPDVAGNGRVPVHIVVSPGGVYHFDGVTVTGLRRLHPSFVTKRFTRLEGKTYSPDVLDDRFRTLMRLASSTCFRSNRSPSMDICCGSTSRQRRPKARNLVFGSDSTPTKGRSPVCKSAIAICSATVARSPQPLRSRNAAIEAKFYMRTRSSLTQILCSRRKHSL